MKTTRSTKSVVSERMFSSPTMIWRPTGLDAEQACTCGAFTRGLLQGRKSLHRLFEKSITCMKSGPIRWRVYLTHIFEESQVKFYFQKRDKPPLEPWDGKELEQQ